MVERIRLRGASSEDGPFLLSMLVEAVNWGSRQRVPPGEVEADPALIRYVHEWPRSGEIGVIAEEAAPIGAAWMRFFTADVPGYGYVAEDVPELSMGVVAEWRRRGVGRALLRETARRARKCGIHRISLSVERANVARRLYAAEGYVVVASVGDADTIVLDL